MSTRASDSSKFTRWDQDSLRGGIQTHPGIDDGVASWARCPRTNRASLLARQEPDSDQMVGGSNPSGRATSLVNDRPIRASSGPKWPTNRSTNRSTSSTLSSRFRRSPAGERWVRMVGTRGLEPRHRRQSC
jgi:hypothetical protein